MPAQFMKAKDLKVGDRWYHPPDSSFEFICTKLQNTLISEQKGPESVGLKTGVAYWTPLDSEVKLVWNVKTVIKVILTGTPW